MMMMIGLLTWCSGESEDMGEGEEEGEEGEGEEKKEKKGVPYCAGGTGLRSILVMDKMHPV